MKSTDLSPLNVGPACKIYRREILNQTQREFAEENHFAVSNYCGFENGNVMSLSIFIRMIELGFIENLANLDYRKVMQEADICQQRRYFNTLNKRVVDYDGSLDDI